MTENRLHEEQNISRRYEGDRLNDGWNLQHGYDDDRLHEEQDPPEGYEGANSEVYVSGTNS